MQKAVTSNIPRGVGCPPPPGMDPRKGKGKLMCIKVRMLDDSVGVFHLGHKAAGQALFEEVCRYLNLLESDYFGLEFIDSYGNRCWLDKDKSILRQIMVAQSDARFFFVVKFYTPNPAELEEEYTRYLFALQIRRDLSRGELICSNENTAALLVALIVQSECGDFSPLDYPDAGAYLAGTHFVPHQTPTFAQAVLEQHRRLIGMEPAEADFVLLETARRCDFYGLRLHPARDIEGTEVALAVAHMGIKVFHQMNCVTTFSWAKVRKLSFKRKRMMIKVHPDSFQFYKETIEFSFENRDDCKNFWKKCVEHHSFFRGRTQKQLIDYVREHRKRREPFQRPLRRGNAVPGGGTNSLGRAQFLVSDRTNNERTGGVMGNGQPNGRKRTDKGGNFMCTFPSLCQQKQTQQQNGRDSRKGRPKSAIVAAGDKRGQKDGNKMQPQKQQRQIDMQNSYHAGMAQQHELRNGTGQIGASNSLNDEAMALFHQHMDPMCMSMPNVLATDSFLGTSKMAAPSVSVADPSSHSSFLHSAHKSVSGENFHYAAELREDNQSEGSYRVGWLRASHPHAAPQRDDAGSSTASSQSDIVSASTAHSPVDPRVYQTTFTTKRVGNVIMKRVMNSNGTANDTSAAPTNAAAKYSAPRRPPLTSRSAVDGDESDSLASSSVAFSDYSLANTAPPASSFPGPPSAASASASAASSKGGAANAARIRCTPPPIVTQPQQQQQQQFVSSNGTCQVLLPVHLRNEVPVPIDEPPPVNIVSRPGQHHQATAVPIKTTSTIIRPVLLPSPASAMATNSMDKAGRANLSGVASSANSALFGIGTAAVRPSSSSTASSTSTPTQSTTAQRRPIVLSAKASPSPPPPPPLLNIKSGGRTAQRVAVTTKEKQKTKQREEREHNETEDEILLGGEVSLNGPTTFVENAIVKPKVPPKPDKNALIGVGQQQQKKRKEEINQNLVGPLESILKDVRSMNEALDVLESPTGNGGMTGSTSSQKVGAAGTETVAEGADHQQNQQRSLITNLTSNSSDDCPSVRTVHLFNNGDNRVPYTLTVRDLSGGVPQQQRTTSEVSREETQWYGGSCSATSARNGGFGRSRIATALEGCPKALSCVGGGQRHKSLELVHRKRLPPQGAFSSQDHSIAATSPEAGNVLEYVVAQRQRSASTDRNIGITAQQNANGGQSAEREKTQTVEKEAKGTAEENESQNLEEKCGDKVPTMEDEGGNSEKDESAAQQPQELLETDF
ncbi:hypothetical protein niasHT_039552 [Heterodera trifolii]|uniref:FERM domain-containing protein n=1 Tax=Heterodera trifolii TaxID=157864 RepID=A0ABD2IL21_9BILA